MKCAQADAFIHAYVDGELAGIDRDSYEKHLLDCDSCFRASRLQARFKAAVRGHLARPVAPEALRRRILDTIAVAPPPMRRWPWQLYPRLAPMFLLAVSVAIFVVNTRGGQSPVFKQALRAYQAAMPMDVTDSDCLTVAQWLRPYVDFAVKPPPVAPRGGCQGGRLMPVSDRMGAYFEVLTNNGHKLGVLVYAGEDEPIRAVDHRVINGKDVYVVSSRGASSMAFRDNDGLYYVVTGDVDQDQLTGFLPAALAH